MSEEQKPEGQAPAADAPDVADAPDAAGAGGGGTDEHGKVRTRPS